MKFRPLIFIAIFGTALSCSSNPCSIPIVDVNIVKNSIHLELSDFLKDIEVIELETTEYNLDCMHPFVAYISHTSIMVRTRGALHQFDRQGRYIRKLTERGNGPNEFHNIDFCFVDEEADILYYADGRSIRMIFRIDLISGQFLEPLQAGFDTRRYAVSCYKNNSVYGFPMIRERTYHEGNDPDLSVVAFQYDLLSDSINKHYGNHKYYATMHPYGKSMVGYGNHISLFNMHYSDTLYRLQNNALEARFFVKMKNKMTDDSAGEDYLDLLFEYEEGIVLARNRYIRESFGGVRFVADYPEQYLLLNPDGGLKIIGQVYINPLEIVIKTEAWVQKGKDNIDDILKTTGLLSSNDAQKEKGESEDIVYPFPKPSGSYGYLFIEQEKSNPHIIIGKIR